MLTTYDRKEKYDYHYEKEFAKPGECNGCLITRFYPTARLN